MNAQLARRRAIRQHELVRPVLAAFLILSAPAAAAPSVSVERAREIVYPAPEQPPAGCASLDVRCWLSARYASNTDAQASALALFDEFGDVAGVEREHNMEGGFRGVLHLVPAWPLAKADAKHLAWILAMQREFAAFDAAMKARGGAAVAYRHRGIAWKFLRSVKRRTPSAYASRWEIGYNLDGSLNTSPERVRDLLVHEIFHLNDQAHANWSASALAPIVQRIFAKCKTNISCLAPYAPTTMKVKGGTYYAFQPNNGNMANEYAAELATRFFLEQRAVLRAERDAGDAFKCATAENKQAWSALSAEFFAGVDLTAPCR